MKARAYCNILMLLGAFTSSSVVILIFLAFSIFRRPNWVNYTTTTLWNTLLGTTLRLSDAHATLSEIFGKHMVQRLIDLDEDANRLHKQVHRSSALYPVCFLISIALC